MKITTKEYFNKENKYPPLIFPEKDVERYARLKLGMEKNVWVESAELGEELENLNFDDWAALDYEPWLEYKEFDSPL